MSAFELNIKADTREVDKMFKALSTDLVDKAAARAINKTIKTVRTHVVRDIAKRTSLKQKVVRARIFIGLRANKRKLIGWVSTSKKGVNLIELVPQAKRNIKAFRRKPGVIAKVWGHKITHGAVFIAPGRYSNKMLAFKRTGPRTTSPPKPVFAPNVSATFVIKRVRRAMDRIADPTWTKNFERELNFELLKLNK